MGAKLGNTSNWSTRSMNYKYVAAGLFTLAFILGWNVFLIQRDEQMYGSYYRSKAIENLKKPPSTEIK